MKQVLTALRGVYSAVIRRISALFGGRIRPDILKATLLESKLLTWACVVIVLLVIATIIYTLNPPRTEPQKYALETHGSEIDFTSPDVTVHTADAGIAVIGGPEDAAVMIADEPVPDASVPAADGSAPIKLTADPATIWTEEPADLAASATHGGFTLPVAMDDESIGVLTIPAIDLSVRVYETGDDMADMERGVAHFKSTSAWEGNIGLSAHNVNFSGTAGYFYSLHTLETGAVIRYETALGSREYAVESVSEIAETDWSALARTEDNRITLITCITGKPTQRLCVQALEKTQ